MTAIPRQVVPLLFSAEVEAIPCKGCGAAGTEFVALIVIRTDENAATFPLVTAFVGRSADSADAAVSVAVDALGRVLRSYGDSA